MIPGAAIPISGLGVISALGTTQDQVLESLHSGEVTSRLVDDSRGWHRPRGSCRAALVEGPDSNWKPPGVVMRRLSRPSRCAVAAAFGALHHDPAAGTSWTPDPALGVSMATMFGPSLFTEKIMEQTLDHGPGAVSPSLFTECVANAAAAQISLKTLARGPNLTMVAREAGPACAIIQAVDLLRRGKARRMFAGIAEEITPFLHSRLDRMGALARPEEDLSEAARPFDRRRNGVLAAEGATVLLLESPEVEAASGKQPLARILGGSMAFDATASRSGWGHGIDNLAAALTRMLDKCQVSLDSIDLIVSGAGGSKQGDRLEAGVLKRVWGSLPLPAIIAPKAITGEFGGAFLAASVLAAAGLYRGTPGTGFQPDPELGLTLHTGASLEPPHRTLITAPASGGTYGWLILERPSS
jgi:3-oxoacyl-[acyl-carrier-protein] synthase II